MLVILSHVKHHLMLTLKKALMKVTGCAGMRTVLKVCLPQCCSLFMAQTLALFVTWEAIR